MMSDDRRSIAQSIILTHTTLKDEKSCSIYSYHDIKHGRDHLVLIMKQSNINKHALGMVVNCVLWGPN